MPRLIPTVRRLAGINASIPFCTACLAAALACLFAARAPAAAFAAGAHATDTAGAVASADAATDTALVLATALAEAASDTALILTTTLADAITPATARFVMNAIETAGEREAELLVISLDTPGGLMDSMRDIVKSLLGSEVPVAVYVSPAGSRAASAGTFITMAAHIAAMAPGTNIGAAHPVSATGAMDSTMSVKATNDAVALARSIARERGRNEDWAERAVRESVSLSSGEAVRAGVVDFEAPTLDSLLAFVHGREVETTFGGRVLQTRLTLREEIRPSLRDQVLSVIGNPNIAYILMLIGIYGMIFELSNPGAILPGVLGAICLILALYSFQSLPLNYAGVLLVLVGFVLLLLEVKVTSYGVLAIGGIAALLLGSLMLVRSPSPFVRISLGVILPGVGATALFLLYIVGAGLRAQRGPRVAGREALVGQAALVRSPLAPRGQVLVAGEIWTAESPVPVEAGSQVVVEQVEGLLLKVRPLEARRRDP